jgi:hypothetical protein
MALSAGLYVSRRGAARGNDFGYPVAPGEKVWRGGICCLNSAGYIVRPQTAGALVAVGIADRDLDNTASASPSGTSVVATRGCWGLTVPSATPANVEAPVYATDDGTLTLAQPGSGFTGQIGTLSGIDNGQTYILIIGS